MKQDRIDYSKPIPVRLPPDLLARVDALAKKISEPRSTVMRFAMKLGLGALEGAFEQDPKNLIALIYPQAPGPMELNEAPNSEKDIERTALQEIDRASKKKTQRGAPPKAKP